MLAALIMQYNLYTRKFSQNDTSRNLMFIFSANILYGASFISLVRWTHRDKSELKLCKYFTLHINTAHGCVLVAVSPSRGVSEISLKLRCARI